MSALPSLTHLTLSTTLQVHTIINPILEMEKRMPRGRKRLAQPPANKLSSRANQDLNPGSPASASECKERAVSWDGYSSIPEWKKREITVVRIQVTLTTVPAITKQSRVNKPDY